MRSPACTGRVGGGAGRTAMICRDWRGEPVCAIQPLYAVERERWRRRLFWDGGATWDVVERARRSRALPGLVLRDGAAIAGWAFFLLHQDTLQIGAFVARTQGATRRLLDGILASETARSAGTQLLFTFSEAPALHAALTASDFAVEPYAYLERPCSGRGRSSGGRGDPALPAWDPRFHDPLSRLLATAYGDAEPTRPFARGGSDGDWREYVSQLTATEGCGRLLPDESVVVPGDAGLDAAVLTTRIAADTAHIAQAAVAPACRRRGLGRLAIETALDRIAAAGYARATLLVSGRNAVARRMYAGLGFVERSAFVSACRSGQPRRLNSPALDTGGVRIFR
ncbi:MAG: GNAT family N-acetyltransferase [Acidobacteria bacterium]|nr:GNAT family N-acetyltransferase [Acidobacteriota bacterium]